MTRAWTPPVRTDTGGTRITVKRCCDQCGRPLGDVTELELAAAIAGEMLPSVADECGCRHTVEQLALFANAADHTEHGTVLWPDLPVTSQQEYLRDARNTLRAIVHLGWAPTVNGIPTTAVAQHLRDFTTDRLNGAALARAEALLTELTPTPAALAGDATS